MLLHNQLLNNRKHGGGVQNREWSRDVQQASHTPPRKSRVYQGYLSESRKGAFACSTSLMVQTELFQAGLLPHAVPVCGAGQ